MYQLEDGACHQAQLYTLHNHKYAILLSNKWYMLPFIEVKIRPHVSELFNTQHSHNAIQSQYLQNLKK